MIWGFPIECEGGQRMELRYRRQGQIAEDCPKIAAAVAGVFPTEELRENRTELTWYIRGPFDDDQIKAMVAILKWRIGQIKEPFNFGS